MTVLDVIHFANWMGFALCAILPISVLGLLPFQSPIAALVL